MTLRMHEPGPKRSVLVVDDDEDVRMSLRDVLETEGWTVDEAVNGREAQEALSAGARPSVVLLDLMMPIMSGTQLLKWLRAQDGELGRLPVVVLTASLRQRELGAQLFLEKPVHADRLLRALEPFSERPALS